MFEESLWEFLCMSEVSFTLSLYHQELSKELCIADITDTRHQDPAHHACGAAVRYAQWEMKKVEFIPSRQGTSPTLIYMCLIRHL